MTTITVNNFRDQAPEFLFHRLSNGQNVLIDAPPGLGKTKAAVTMVSADQCRSASLDTRTNKNASLPSDSIRAC
jgi:Lhr-like helicase